MQFLNLLVQNNPKRVDTQLKITWPSENKNFIIIYLIVVLFFIDFLWYL